MHSSLVGFYIVHQIKLQDVFLAALSSSISLVVGLSVYRSVGVTSHHFSLMTTGHLCSASSPTILARSPQSPVSLKRSRTTKNRPLKQYSA